jgi:hypothetical protein
MSLKNSSYWSLLSASLSDGNGRYGVNQDPRGRRASFDGNACDLAVLCTPSCRNTPGGPPRTVPLSRDTRLRRAYGNACDLAVLCTPSCRNTPGGPPRTVPLSRDTVPEEEVALVATAGTGTGPHSRRAESGGAEPHSGRRIVSSRSRGCLEACGRFQLYLGGTSAPVPERGLAHQRQRQQRSSAPDAGSGCR